jgi:hypothetical protein
MLISVSAIACETINSRIASNIKCLGTLETLMPFPFRNGRSYGLNGGDSHEISIDGACPAAGLAAALRLWHLTQAKDLETKKILNLSGRELE